MPATPRTRRRRRAESLAANLVAQTGSEGLGLSDSQAQDLAGVLTGPLKALGAASALAAMAATLSRTALALVAEAGGGGTVPEDVIAQLEMLVGVRAGATGDSLAQAASKVKLIVDAAIEATTEALAVAVASVQNLGSMEDMSTDGLDALLGGIKDGIAGDYQSRVEAKLAELQPGVTNKVTLAALPNLLAGISTDLDVLSVSVAAARAAGGLATFTVKDATTGVVDTSFDLMTTLKDVLIQAQATAEAAHDTVIAANTSDMNAAATAAFNAAQMAATYRDVVTTKTKEMLSKVVVDSSVTALFQAAIHADTTAATESAQATSAIVDVVSALEGLQKLLNGTLQKQFDAEIGIVANTGAAATAAWTAAEAAAQKVLLARGELRDRMVDQKILEAKVAVLTEAKTAAQSAHDTATADVNAAIAAKGTATAQLGTLLGQLVASTADKQTKDAASVLLESLLIGNAEAGLTFAKNVQALYKAEMDRLGGMLGEMETALEAANTLVTGAALELYGDGTTEHPGLEKIAGDALADAVAAENDAATALKDYAVLQGQMALAQAAAAGQAEGRFIVASEAVLNATTQAEHARQDAADAAPPRGQGPPPPQQRLWRVPRRPRPMPPMPWQRL
ncbi:MAG: Uncharacterized protein FD149_477 [Rhodospirillaceae bacterium]|nr:MAG: Uncharacterized protein FD149_477 [Rhodospirillaceae bacterium]